MCTAVYSELRRISSIRKYPAVDATKTLTSAFILSRLDFCNALLSGVPQYLLDRLQCVQNAAASLTVKASNTDLVIPTLTSLYWLPVVTRIQYKILSLCYSFLSYSGPEYPSTLIQAGATSSVPPAQNRRRLNFEIHYKKGQ